MDAEWTILYSKLEKIVASGAKVVLSKLPIGDVATQYFADRCVGVEVGVEMEVDVNARVLCCVVVCSVNDLARHVCVCID